MSEKNRNSTEFGSSWPNPYLSELEQRKKVKPRLLHEFGQGAPCLRCGDGCPGFSLHYWRKVCKNCRCGKEFHDVQEEEDPGIRRIGRLFDDPPAKYMNPGSNLYSFAAQSEIMYEWVPPGVSNSVAIKYIESLPPEKRPVKNSDGANFRKYQLERQIPEHDINPAACDNLTTIEAEMMTQFVENIKKNIIGQGTVEEPESQKHHCYGCSESILPGDVAIFAARAGKDKCWHPKCFVCCVCNEILQDLIYYYKDFKLYCGRHFADSVLPRCSACDELIFNKAYTQAEGRPWHVKHFCCHMCDKALAGFEYIAKDRNPYCLDCYEKTYGEVCKTCDKKIAPHEPRIVHNNFNYHATSLCFHCGFCGNSLVKSRFVSKPPKVFCNGQCARGYMDGVSK